MQDAQVEEKKRTLQIYLDQKEARRQILKRRDQQARDHVNLASPASSIPYGEFKSQVITPRQQSSSQVNSPPQDKSAKDTRGKGKKGKNPLESSGSSSEESSDSATSQS